MRKYTRYNAQSFNDAMICTMDSIRKYMLEIILHQQRTLHLLKQKTLMQTQEDHSIQTQVQIDSGFIESQVNDTNADDADIRPIYDEEPMAEVQLTAECNIFAIGQQHTEQPEIIVEGRVDQYPETCQVKSHMLDSSPDNQTTEYSKQSLESENILLKETVA
ncbi:hypothetical protein Tco_0340339 [Tanacetum coccineum]